MLVPFKKSAPPRPSGEPPGDRTTARRRGRAGLLLPAVAVLVAAAGGAAWRLASRTDGPRYVAVPVVAVPLAARVTANGAITPRVTVQVGSQVSGRIQEILVDFNSPVAKGQVLARLDPELFRASMAQSRANLIAALGNLTKAQARARHASKILARARMLVARDLIAGADFDTAEAESDVGRGEVAAAKGDVAQARAAVRQAQVNLAYTTIVSPVDGVVISRNVDVGQTVAASLQAPTLFTIAQDLRAMQIHTSVPEADVGKLQAGMKATFTVDAFPDEKWSGTVREVRNASQVSQNVVTYDAVVDVENRGGRLRPGMTATVAFVYAERARAIAIPNAALRYQPRGPGWQATGSTGEGKPHDGRRSVYILVDGTPVRRMVRLGISDGKLTEVIDGEVAVGDRVVTDDKAEDLKRDGGRRLPSRV